MNTSTNFLLILFLLNQNFPLAKTLNAYDCRDNVAPFTSISLLETDRCEDPERDYEQPITATAQVLEISDKFPIEAHSCQIIRTETVTRCGFTSITYGSETPIFNQRMVISPEECSLAVKTGKLKLLDRVFSVAVGRPSWYKYYSHGSRDNKGNCKTATFITNGIQYTGSYQLTSLEITIKKVRGLADVLTNTVTFTNGLKGNLQKASLSDFTEGLIVWDSSIPDPLELTSTVMKGEGRLYAKTDRSDLYDSIFVIEKEETSQIAGLIVKDKAPMVKASNCFGTQLNKIIICLLSVPGHWNSDAVPSKFLPENSQDSTHFESMLSYVTISSTLSLMDKFATLHTQLCLLHQDLIRTKLQQISGSNNPHSLVSVFGRGHQIAAAGGAAYIVKCKEVMVQQTSYSNCTLELPVLLNGTLMFMDIITHNLQTFPSIITCSKQMPPRYPMPNGIWLCGYPDLQECLPPMRLPVTNSIINFNTSVLDHLGNSVYSEEQRAATRSFLDQFSARSPVEYGLTANVVLDNPDGLDDSPMIIPMSHIDINQLQRELNINFFGGIFSFLGDAFDDFIGILLLISIARVLLTMLTRVIILLNERGCGWWLFTVVWGTAFDVVRVPVHFVRTAFDSIQNPALHPGQNQDFDPPPTSADLRAAPIYVPLNTWRSYHSHDLPGFPKPPGPNGLPTSNFSNPNNKSPPPSYPPSAAGGHFSPTTSTEMIHVPLSATLPPILRKNHRTNGMYPPLSGGSHRVLDDLEEEEQYQHPKDSKLSRCNPTPPPVPSVVDPLLPAAPAEDDDRHVKDIEPSKFSNSNNDE